MGHLGLPTGNPEFLSIAQVATRLGISRPHCYRLAARGLLPVLELGRRKVVPTEWLNRWLDDRYEDLSGSEAPVDRADGKRPGRSTSGAASENRS